MEYKDQFEKEENEVTFKKGQYIAGLIISAVLFVFGAIFEGSTSFSNILIGIGASFLVSIFVAWATDKINLENKKTIYKLISSASFSDLERLNRMVISCAAVAQNIKLEEITISNIDEFKKRFESINLDDASKKRIISLLAYAETDLRQLVEKSIMISYPISDDLQKKIDSLWDVVEMNSVGCFVEKEKIKQAVYSAYEIYEQMLLQRK